MNPWDDPNYYGIAEALTDVVTSFAQQGNINPTIDEICEVATPFFKRAGVANIGECEKAALDCVRPTMWLRIEKRMGELLEYTDFVI